MASPQLAQIVFGTHTAELNRYVDGIKTEDGRFQIAEEETVGVTLQRLFHKTSFVILEYRRFHEMGGVTVVSEEEPKQLLVTAWKNIQIPIQLFLA